MNAAQVWRKLSGRSRSDKPPRTGSVLTEHGPEAGPDASHGMILYLEDITVSFDGFRALNALTLLRVAETIRSAPTHPMVAHPLDHETCRSHRVKPSLATTLLRLLHN